MYCGDETGSFIGDVGSHSCRFGYGGEDNPKMVVPSYVNMQTKTLLQSCLKPLNVGGSLGDNDGSFIQSILRRPICRPGSINGNLLSLQPIVNPDEFLQQGEAIENFDALEVAWHAGMDTLRAKDTLKHTKGGTPYTPSPTGGGGSTDKTGTTPLPSPSSSSAPTTQHAGLATSSTLQSTSTNNGDGKCVHPVLAVTPGMTHYYGDGTGTGPKYGAAIQRQQYIQYTELVMESLEATSMFLAPSPMLAAFSHGRKTALVVDVGAGGCRVTPVVDGLVLQHSQRRNGRGGDWLDHMSWNAILEYKKSHGTAAEDTSSSTVPTILPRYQIRQQRLSHQKEKDEGKNKYIFSPTYHQWAMQDLLYELRTSPSVKLDPIYSTFGPSPPCFPFMTSESNGHAKADNSTGDTKTEGDVDADGDTTMKSTPPASPTANEKSGNHDWYYLPDGTKIDLSPPTPQTATIPTTTTLPTTIQGHDFCRVPELLFAETSLPFASSYNNGNGSSSAPSSTFHTLSNEPVSYECIQKGNRCMSDRSLCFCRLDLKIELTSCRCSFAGPHFCVIMFVCFVVVALVHHLLFSYIN